MNTPRPPTNRPAAGRRPPAPAVPPKKGPRWGWLEWFVVSQTALPALLFLPGVSAVRTANRVSAYAVALAAWASLSRRPRPAGAPPTGFPARPWLLFSIAWLVLSVAHPNTYSMAAGFGQVLLYVAVLSPAFWAGDALESPRQVGRLMAVLFLCNALSATVGLGQAFYPDRLNPPVIPAMNNQFQGEDVTYEAGGVKIIRPCGLTDTPGAAAPAGGAAALIGLCWALRPVAWWKRLGSLGLAFVGVAVIYYTQVRLAMVMLAVCGVVLTTTWALRGEFRNALALAAGGVGLIVGALAWVSARAGEDVVGRFGTLLGGDPGKLYGASRGSYVEEALYQVLPDYPLGTGLGWWGTIYSAFGDPSRPSPVWVEVMVPAWVYDGGLPLLVGYGGAVLAAVYDSARVALTTKDRDLSFWGAVVLAQNVGVVASCFSYVVFLSPLGVQFWLLAAVLNAADARTRAVGVGVGPRVPRPRGLPGGWPWRRPSGPAAGR